MTTPTRTHLLSRSRSSMFVPIVGSLGIAGCAAAPAPMPAVAAPPPVAVSRETSPADGEMLSIAKAEEEIDRLFPGAPAGRAGGKRAPSQAPDDARIAPSKDADADGHAEGRALSAAGDSCATACKALGSMASSADRLCRLAGENDGRCDDARARVRGATSRVKASCPSCVVAVPSAPLAPAAAPPPPGPPPGMPGSGKTIE